MTDAAIQARREYNRQWRAKNPDKVKQYKVNHWEKKAQQAAAQQAGKAN